LPSEGWDFISAKRDDDTALHNFWQAQAPGTPFSIAKDFHFPRSFTQILEGMWNRAADKNPSFGNCPTKKKMPEDNRKQVRNAVLCGQMNPTGKEKN
jgi:hypothetical protein